MTANRFQGDLTFGFEGNAAKMIDFLRVFYHNFGDDGRRMVDDFFDMIREEKRRK